MKVIDLVKSLKAQAQWSSFKDKDGYPISGEKWLTKKQVNFLHNLWSRENENTDAHFDGSTWIVDNYFIKLNRKAPNGCRKLHIELINETK